jgi:hypothetical protein
VFPDFLCIGAQKAGTTWLYDNLRQQPGIWLPPIKELHFLDHPSPPIAKRLFAKRRYHALARANARSAAADWIRGSGDFESLKIAWRLAFAERSLDSYTSVFPARPDLVRGEICPGYAHLPPEVIRSLAERNPRLKVIYLLRDPIDRAWSSVAMHFRKQGRQTIIKETIGEPERAQLLNRIDSPAFLSHCKYDENISNWLRYLPQDQVYFGFFERIETDPLQCLADILVFLGITQKPAALAPEERVNAGKGEAVDAVVQRELGFRLYEEAMRADARFGNAYTAQWVAHAQALTTGEATAGPA